MIMVQQVKLLIKLLPKMLNIILYIVSTPSFNVFKLSLTIRRSFFFATLIHERLVCILDNFIFMPTRDRNISPAFMQISEAKQITSQGWVSQFVPLFSWRVLPTQLWKLLIGWLSISMAPFRGFDSNRTEYVV